MHTLPSTRVLLKVFRPRNGILLRQRAIILTFPSTMTITCIIASLSLDTTFFIGTLRCLAYFLGSWVLGFLGL